MDRTESHALKHLRSRGFDVVVFEPDGNVPPDFLIEGRIAVEVRRLNENVRGHSKPKGLEEVEVPLLKRIRKVLASYGDCHDKHWGVIVDFRRPVPSPLKVEKAVRLFLDDVLASSQPKGMRRKVAENLTLEVFPWPREDHDTFSLGIQSDDDSGGWVVEEMERNLRLCITDKSKKIAKYRNQ